MSNPIVYGPSYSTYVPTARLAFEEKGVAYDLVDVAMMTGAHKQSAYLARHPFTPEGAEMLAAQPSLKAWWGRIAERPSMTKTPPQFG